MLKAMKSSYEIEYCNFISAMDFTITKQLTSCWSNEEIDDIEIEELKDEKFKTTDIVQLGEKQPFKINKQFKSRDFSDGEVKCFKHSIKLSPVLKLKSLPLYFKYIYLEDSDILFVIIYSYRMQRKKIVQWLYQRNI